MSIYQKASLVQIPSGYKAADAKLYSVVPNSGDGDFTVSSDADATRVNKDGLVETTVANQARLNYDPTNPQDPHLLLEPTRTNYLTNSNNASLWGVSTSNGTVTTTPNYSTAPNGSNEATRLEASVSGGSGFALLSKSTTSFFGDYSTFVYLKSNTGSNQNVCIYGRNTGNQVVTVTSEWQKFELNGNSTSGQSNFINVGINLGFVGEDNPIDVLIWGGQIEQGSYATTLIPTAGSAVTRTEDNVYGAGDANLFSGDGTIFLDIEPFTHIGDPRISLSNSTVQNKIFFSFVNSTQVRMGVYENPNLFAEKYQNISYNTRIKLALTYKQNEFKFAFNGSVVHTDTFGEVPTGLNQLRFSAGGGAQKFQGKVFQAMVFNEALTEAELITLTS